MFWILNLSYQEIAQLLKVITVWEFNYAEKLGKSENRIFLQSYNNGLHYMTV